MYYKNLQARQMINQPVIDEISQSVTFSDGTSLKSRTSKLIEKDGKYGFSIDITGINFDEANYIRQNLLEKIKNIAGEINFSIVLTGNAEQKHKNSNSKEKHVYIEGVRNTILVASGKGGVGKSTVAALIAYKLANKGKKVGIADLDIYGPSMPTIFNLSSKPELKNNRMIPLKSKIGIEVNSIGFLTSPGTAVSFRGPMASKTVYQLLSLTKWGELDYLIIDSPPGTGDIHLSLLQNYHINSIIMVTTPQKIAREDVSRAITLYKKFDVKLSAIIENMSYFYDNGLKIPVFSGNAGEEISREHKVPLISRIPIKPQLSTACDNGRDLSEFCHLINSNGALDWI